MKKILIFLLIAQITVSCSKKHFNIDNPNYPIAKEVLADANDFKNYNISNHNSLFQAQVSLSGVFFRGLSDQFTTTNAYLGFWTFTDEPRRSLPNSTANDDLPYQMGYPWGKFNEIINNANIIQKTIESDGLVINDDNTTKNELAGSYFDKGVAQGYLSMIYDKAFVVNYDTDVNNLQFKSYTEVLDAAIQNITKAIDLANQVNSFQYQIYKDGPILDKNEFIKLANAYMARFSIAIARSDAEAANLDYNQILNYANNAIDADFWPPSKENVFYNNLQDWSLYMLSDGSGYMPTDIKIQHLFDPNYPVEYPTQSGVVLPPANSNDPRLTDYYEYVGGNFGYLRESRGRHLFSSYRHIRFWDMNWENRDGLQVQIFPKAEIDYIKAECYYRMGDYAQAVAILDQSPRMTVGGQSTTPAKDNVRNALFYEYSIELDLNSGMAVNWAFMRRHDLLQRGTAIHYPVPASELEVVQHPIYTFGGDANADQDGTSDGSNSWKVINLVY